MTIECAFDGRLGSAPTWRGTEAGKGWAALSIAVKGADKDGDAEWINVAVFQPLANELPDDLGKGERLYVEGKLRVSRWEGTEGPRYSLQVTATRILVLDRIGRKRRKKPRANTQEAEHELQQDAENWEPA